jgi:alkylation response protein AidB-like acyl-CoA dehydrogenase
MLMIQRLGALPLVIARGSGDGWTETLERLATGESTPAFALTERDAGSDPSGMKATATGDGEGWLIDGQKTWISNAREADILVVFAVTDPDAGSKGISAFVVDSHLPGIDIEPTAEKVGLRGMSAGTINFASVRVEGSALLGSEGQGLRIALKTLDASRLGVAAQATGLAQAALDAAAAFANSRSQFGKPLIALPGLAFPLAEHHARVAAGRALLFSAADHAEAASDDAGLLASMAKLVCSETAVSATQAAVHAHGAAGYEKGCDVDRFARDARVTTIYEGTSEIQRMVIARSLVA